MYVTVDRYYWRSLVGGYSLLKYRTERSIGIMVAEAD